MSTFTAQDAHEFAKQALEDIERSEQRHLAEVSLARNQLTAKISLAQEPATAERWTKNLVALEMSSMREVQAYADARDRIHAALALLESGASA